MGSGDVSDAGGPEQLKTHSRCLSENRTLIFGSVAQPQFLLKLNCMLLPFVRELFADVERLPAFARVASHLKEGTGRIRVSGLTPTAKALLLVLFQRAASRPLLLVVNDTRAAEDLAPVLHAFCALTNASHPGSV